MRDFDLFVQKSRDACIHSTDASYKAIAYALLAIAEAIDRHKP